MSQPLPPVAELEKSSGPDPELEQFLKGTPLPDPPFTELEQCRSLTLFADSLLMKAVGPLPENLQEAVVDIPVNKSYTTSATVVRPAKDVGGPLIILIHPSGWFTPSYAKVVPHARGLATLFNATVISPRYRLAPEHPFPTGLNDCWAAIEWAVQNASSLSSDLRKGFIIGGMSTGANFAVALTRRALETRVLPPVTGMWASLFIGLKDEASVPEKYRAVFTSRVQNADGMIIDSRKFGDMLDHYKPDATSPLFNPLAGVDAGAFDVASMPRAYVQVAGADFFRDDGVVLAYALQDHGVPVKLDLYPQQPHSFWLFAPETSASKKCLKDIVVGFAYLLGVDVGTLTEGWETLLASIGCQPNLKMESDFLEGRK